MSRSHLSRIQLAAVAMACAMICAGCATWQGPRIDPTGEQLFVWPNTPPPAVVAPPFPGPATLPAAPAAVAPPPTAPGVAPPVLAPQPVSPTAPLPFGNVQAPPVYSDPPTPAIAPPPGGVVPPVPYVPGAAAPSLLPATVTPAVPNVAPVAGQAPATTVPPGREFLRLTPDRFVAPVGTQVLLKAGVVGADGYLAANQRIEWSVARNGIGQLGDMGLAGPTQLLGWWQAPQKIDEWTATATTAYFPVTLDANSADPKFQLANRTWRNLGHIGLRH